MILLYDILKVPWCLHVVVQSQYHLFCKDFQYYAETAICKLIKDACILMLTSVHKPL